MPPLPPSHPPLNGSEAASQRPSPGGHSAPKRRLSESQEVEPEAKRGRFDRPDGDSVHSRRPSELLPVDPRPERAPPDNPEGSNTAHKRRLSESEPTEPEAKRAKMSTALGRGTNIGSPANRDLLGNLTNEPPRRLYDLLPQSGPKKLVIKNLRETSRPAELARFYDKIRDDLEGGLTAIFASQPPALPFQRLYRGVEDLCRKGDSEELYQRLRTRCEAYLNNELAASIRAEAGSLNDKVGLLRSVYGHWIKWNRQTAIIRSTFSFLDRSYLYNLKVHQQINDMSITLFRRMVWSAPGTETHRFGDAVIKGTCLLIGYERKGDNRFDGALLRDAISMMHICNVYLKLFEPHFLKTSGAFLKEFAEEKSASSLSSYILACEQLLAAEDHRCNSYNFDSTTKRQLSDQAHTTLIYNYSAKLLDNGEVGKLLDKGDVDSMRALNDLLRLSNIQKLLQRPWEEYIKSAGAAIVNDTSRGEEMVVRLLEFRRALDVMVRDAFGQDDNFTYGLRDAFGSFINDRQILSSWKTGTSKVGEMIAKYIDLLLRGGLKQIPQTLLSDNKDRATAEQSGLASTSDEDAELDRQLDNALELFRFIEGKDVFEAFYKQDLARRLLMGRSASSDAERSMLGKLKSECGSIFTHNLEQMFKDQELARDEMISYKTWRENLGHDKSGVDLSVSILSSAAWPTYPDTPLRVPEEVSKQLHQYEKYYLHKHTGRRLTWMHSLAHCVVKAKFNKGTKELLVSAYQAVVLDLFNQVEGKGGDKEFLSYSQIAEASELDGPNLDRTLQSLACGRIRVLSKHPKGKDINPTDTFTVNKALSEPKYRLKINQVQLKETKEENQDTHKKIAQDRQFETQAAIVRIMKSRKEMTHPNLVAEVISQTKSRGAVEPAEIKKNIEKLIEKEYLERDGNAYTYLA